MNIKIYFPALSLLLLFSCNNFRTASNLANIDRVKTDLTKITKTGTFRHYQNLETLNNTASYIFSELEKVCDTVYYQEFTVDGNQYKNVIASIGTNKKERLVIGAHYDVCDAQQGADDNASGVAGTLELARLLSKENLDFRIDFVAYSLEEPPFFGTKDMGSYVHAKSLYDQNIEIKGMICLEMIGYFNDAPNSQKYPLSFMRWFYGNKANFIMVVQNFNNGRFGKKVENLMIKQDLLPTKSITGPKKMPGIDFSDHRNYWKFGYSAVMIANTAFYRNSNYHEPSDTMETLDLKRMCLVIDEICNCICNL